MEDDFLSKQIQDILEEEIQNDSLSSLSFDNLDWFCDDLFESPQVCLIIVA